MEELHNLVVGVRPMLRRLGSRHPLISKVKDLKILLVNNALTVNLEEKENCVALLEEFLLTEANTDIAATAPKLTNGEKKICSLNAAFLFLLKIFPDISKNIKSSKPLSREIELVLNAAEETSLVGLKRALCAYHEEEPDYQEKSTGGMAAEAVKHLVEDFSRECGQPDYFRPFLSEELGFFEQLCEMWEQLRRGGTRAIPEIHCCPSFWWCEAASCTSGRVCSVRVGNMSAVQGVL